MSLHNRRILFIIFLLAFFIIAPLVITYAAGYKISFKRTVFQKTGTLALDTAPRWAKIYLNGKPRQRFFKKYEEKILGAENEESYATTPTKIKNLLPGEYNVKLELDGYWDWQKKLNVWGGITTFAEDIVFFKKDLPLMVQEGNVKQLIFSPDKKFAVMEKNGELFLFNQAAEEISPLDLKTDKTKILWSDNSKNFLVGNAIITVNNLGKPEILKNSLPERTDAARWADGEKIYYLQKKSKTLNVFDLTTGKTEQKSIILPETIFDFFVKNDILFLAAQENKISKLNIQEIKTEGRERTIELPLSSNYAFINTDHKLINLYDENHQALYLIDPFAAFPLVDTINDVKISKWVDENKLLYANDFEIFIYDLNSRQKTLLTRISFPIIAIFWHSSNNYVLYATINSINSIELDDREKRNITEIVKLEKIFSPEINQKNNTLYFGAKTRDAEGLYKLAIQ